MAGYQEARKRIEVSAGEFVRIIRELQELSQDQLAALTGRGEVPGPTLQAESWGRRSRAFDDHDEQVTGEVPDCRPWHPPSAPVTGVLSLEDLHCDYGALIAALTVLVLATSLVSRAPDLLRCTECTR